MVEKEDKKPLNPEPDLKVGDEFKEDVKTEEVFEVETPEVEDVDVPTGDEIVEKAYTDTLIMELKGKIENLEAQNVLMLEVLTKISNQLVIEVVPPVRTETAYELALNQYLGV